VPEGDEPVETPAGVRSSQPPVRYPRLKALFLTYRVMYVAIAVFVVAAAYVNVAYWFGLFGWDSARLGLFTADAEVLFVATAIYTIVIEVKRDLDQRNKPHVHPKQSQP
jgi:hypothetical protein